MNSIEPTSPDAQIRRWCRHHDEAAFDDFYRVQAERLWRFLVARGVHPEGAYDVVADAFERFIKTVCKRPDAPVALLYRIALNAATDNWRRQRVREPGEPVDPQLLGVDAEDAERLVEVDRLLSGLDEAEQNLLLLRYWVGLTHREVAAIIDQPEGTVRRRFAELARRMQAESGEADLPGTETRE